MHLELNPKFSSMFSFVENIESYFEASDDVLYDMRNTIKTVTFEGTPYVVKAFKRPNLINRFAYRYLRQSKAKRSYLYALKVGENLTPEPIAYIEKRNRYLLSESFFISKLFNYDYTIHEVLIDKALEDREQILQSFADFTYTLHEKNIKHNDYSHGNILIKKSAKGGINYEFKIIDINRMQFVSLDTKERLESFSRINADDDDMRIIITHYARLLGLDEDKSLQEAKFYRDEFYRKREFWNKVRGKNKKK